MGAPHDARTLADLAALVLWCYAAIHAVLWCRAIARSEKSEHVVLVFSLAMEMVPFACAMLLVVALGAVLGHLATGIVITLLPAAGLAWVLRAEVCRLTAPRLRTELLRALAAFGLAAGLTLWQAA